METKPISLSFAICTHNEGDYIENLIRQILTIKRPIDEIVVVDDYSEDFLTKAILAEHEELGNIKLYKHELNNHFGNHKNFMNSKCTKDYIFNIDADETLSPSLACDLHNFIELNSTIEVFWVPRVNKVIGITDDHIGKYNWKIDKDGDINWPDYQNRIYKNNPDIFWFGKVHEVLNGYKTYGYFPLDKDYALIHIKDIIRQENQNNFYNKL